VLERDLDDRFGLEPDIIDHLGAGIGIGEAGVDGEGAGAGEQRDLKGQMNK
jgi:hypothetical protein